MDARGWAWIVWDRFDGEDFDVVGRRHEGDAWGPTFELAAGPAFQARAQIALDSEDRAWVAWEEAAVNWGAEYRSVKELWNNATASHGPLHRSTRVRLGTWTMEGELPPGCGLTMDESSVSRSRRWNNMASRSPSPSPSPAPIRRFLPKWLLPQGLVDQRK